MFVAAWKSPTLRRTRVLDDVPQLIDARRFVMSLDADMDADILPSLDALPQLTQSSQCLVALA